ncbi:MAG: sugar ABC transporter substrate-binding protein [Abditibacteriota bacterium]|nr:sugar ABC transporter substrate-binding protein [Abditibacteriota bacterium]
MKKTLFILAGFLLLLGGCGEKRVILYLTDWCGDQEEIAIREHIALFEKEHPNIKVEMENVSWWRMLDKLMIATAGGKTPDVTRVSSEWFAPLAAKGALEPLDEYFKKDNFDIEDFEPKIVNGWCRFNGKTYILPQDIDNHAMYYNKTWFDKLGIPYPDESWDYAKYIEVCKKFCADTNGDGHLDKWGTTGDPLPENYIYAFGGRMLSDDNKRCLMNTPEALAGLQMFQDLVFKYKIAPTREDSAGVFAARQFTNGKAAMYFGGSYESDLTFAKELKGFEWDAAPMPKGPGGRASRLGGSNYGIMSQSKHKKEAWMLLKHLTSTEYQTKMAAMNQQVPARRSAQAGYLKVNRPPKNKQAFLDSIRDGVIPPQVVCNQEMKAMLGSCYERVSIGQENIKDIADKTVEDVNKLLRTE